MRKLWIATGNLLLLAALVWAGGDPWKDKSFEQWDDKDISKIITNSPWAKMVMVEATWKSLPTAEAPPGQVPGQPVGNLPAGAGGGSSGTARGGSYGGASAAPSAQPDTSGYNPPAEAAFNIYWMSSRTLRGAVARRQVLHGGKDPAEAAKYVAAPLEQYQLVVQGRDMTPFTQTNQQALTAVAYLELKKTKEKIAPQKVEFENGPEGKGIDAVVFFFPKKTSGGERTIAADEKSVEFTCKLGSSTLRAKFEPVKMADKEGSDL